MLSITFNLLCEVFVRYSFIFVDPLYSPFHNFFICYLHFHLLKIKEVLLLHQKIHLHRILEGIQFIANLIDFIIDSLAYMNFLKIILHFYLFLFNCSNFLVMDVILNLINLYYISFNLNSVVGNSD